MKVVRIKTNRSYYDMVDAAEESISVGELIETLNEFDKDSKIILSNDGGYTYGYIHEDTIV